MRIVLTFVLIMFLIDWSLSQNVESYVRFRVRGNSELRKLSNTVSIAGVAGDTVFTFVSELEKSTLQAMGYVLEELPLPGRIDPHVMAKSPTEMTEWDRYPTYQTYLEMMRNLAMRYPALCQLDTIGLSAQGRLILALKLSKNVAVREDEPQLLYSSSMHGNELTGYILLLRLAEYLLFNYGRVTPEAMRATALLDNMEIFLNPLFNPDGAYRLGGDTTISNATRGNVNGVDLNRNFPDRISSPSNGTRNRQPETAAMMRWTFKHNFSISANFHGGALVALYPWSAGVPSGEYAACPDDKIFIYLAKVYATQNPNIVQGGFKDGISNSCDWYEVLGGRQDWMYVWQGGHELTVEVSNQYIVPDSLLPSFWNNNKESMLAYLEQGFKGIRGRVTIAGGTPVKAFINILEIPGSTVYSDPSVGTFHRPLLPGTYTFIASAYGYQNDTVRNVVVTDSGATRVDVVLQLVTDIGNVTPKFPARYSLEHNFPNPFNPSTTIRYSLPSSAKVKLAVYDLLGREIATLVNEEQSAGWKEVQWNAASLSSGIYFYELTAGTYVEVKKLVLSK